MLYMKANLWESENEISVHKDYEDLRGKVTAVLRDAPIETNQRCKAWKASHIFAHHPLILCLTGC
jgi:hypothetical protein